MSDISKSETVDLKAKIISKDKEKLLSKTRPLSRVLVWLLVIQTQSEWNSEKFQQLR